MKTIILLLLGLSVTTTYSLDNVFPKLLDMYLKDEATLFVDDDNDSYFDGRTLRTYNYSLRITNYEILDIGHKENKHKDSSIIVFYYDTYVNEKFKNDYQIKPYYQWLQNFEAYQDNDPNMLKPLELGEYLGEKDDDRDVIIKPGGKVSSTIAYKLNDLETPVTLTAIDEEGNIKGSHDFEIKRKQNKNKNDKKNKKEETTTNTDESTSSKETTTSNEVSMPAHSEEITEYNSKTTQNVPSETNEESHYIPEITEPITEYPTVTEPPVTEPPVTEPPVTEPPVTELEILPPPGTEAPMGE